MEIIKNVIEVTEYSVEGETFTSKESAEEYVDSMKAKLKRKYYVVKTHPDLTQSYRHGIELDYGKETIISTPNDSLINVVYQYLFRSQGEPLVTSKEHPIAAYLVDEGCTFNNITDLTEFLNTKRSIGFNGGRGIPDVVNLNNFGELI